MEINARSAERKGEVHWQTLQNHLDNVALLAGSFAEAFGAGEWGAAAGELHDRGKASLEFQERLKGRSIRVDHSTAGAQWAERHLTPGGRLLAACIAGHHAGLSDGKSEEESCLASRLRNEDIPKLLPNAAAPSVKALPRGFPFKQAHDFSRIAFQAAFFTRMLFSCLVDADCLDSEHFMDPEKAAWRTGFPSLEEVHRRFQKSLDALLTKAEPSDINRRRREILDACRARAQDSPGLFSLTVPTGGGKTLSSLAFALEHARRHGLRRIIYVIPFTSIIEQNARVFRDFVGDDAVLEHHSAFDAERFKKKDSEQDEAWRRFELAAENWDAPLVVTTNVQFFESLFAARTSRCRKLHNIAQSVVILDEAQMIPVDYLRPCLEALRELTVNYGTTVVLCTATQPALSRTEEFPDGLDLDPSREIMDDPKALYEAFRRVRVENAGTLSTEALSERLRESDRVLCVVNTRPEARRVFESIRDEEGAYHLSALMCPEHRSVKLEEIRDRLVRKLPCRLVSTRLIEAGVDIDFPVVFRAPAGIDSLAQAAGRCNREGQLPEPGRVVLYTPEENPLPPFLRSSAEAAEETLRHHDDPLSLAAVEHYFRLHYWGEDQRKGLDAEGILDSLKKSAGELFFPFRTVAEQCRFIREEGESVLIPWDDTARGLLRDLRYAEFPGRFLRRLQRYAVQVPRWAVRNLETAGAVERIQGIYAALTAEGCERFYGAEVGLGWEGNPYLDPELCVV